MNDKIIAKLDEQINQLQEQISQFQSKRAKLAYKKNDMTAMWECAELVGRIKQGITALYQIDQLKQIISELTANDKEPLPFS